MKRNVINAVWIGCIFNGIHVAAWNFSFASKREQLLWQINQRFGVDRMSQEFVSELLAGLPKCQDFGVSSPNTVKIRVKIRLHEPSTLVL